MAFEIGAIEGRLELDRTPFTEGLRLARAQADAFERNKITPVVDADTGAADAKLAATDAELEKLDHTRATPKVDVDTRDSGRGLGLLGASIIALGPAAIAAGGIAAGALAPIAVATAGLALVALPALKDLHDAATKTGAAQQKAISDLGPGAAPAIAAFRMLNQEWHQFRADLNPAVFALLASTFHLLGASMQAFEPVIRLAAQAANQLVQGLIPLAPIFGQAFARMGPIITLFTGGLLHLAQALAGWTQGQGFIHFVQYVVANGPLLAHTLLQVVQLFIQLGIAGSPLLPVLLHIIGALSQLLTLILKIPGIGPALVAFAAIGVTALQIGRAVGWLKDSWVIATPVIEGAMSALGAGATALLANPVIAAAAVIIAALAYIVTHWQQTVAFLKSLWQGALDAYNSTIGLIPGLHIGGPTPPNKLQAFVDQQRQAQHGGGGDFSGRGSGNFGGGDFSAQDLAGGLPQLTVPGIAVPGGRTPRLPALPRISVPRAAPIAAVPITAPTIPTTRTGSRGGSSVPFARSGTQQAITGGGLAGPRSIAHDFVLADEGITGQTVRFRHSPDYGQRSKDKHTIAVDRNTRQLQRVGDFMEKQDRKGAEEVIKLDIGGRSETTELRRRRGQRKR